MKSKTTKIEKEEKGSQQRRALKQVSKHRQRAFPMSREAFEPRCHCQVLVLPSDILSESTSLSNERFLKLNLGLLKELYSLLFIILLTAYLFDYLSLIYRCSSAEVLLYAHITVL